MNPMKSSNTNSTRSGLSALRRVFSLSIPATMVLSAALAVIVAVAIDGCSQKQDKQSPSSSGQNLAQSTLPNTAPAEPSPTPTPAVRKKAVVKRPSTVTYKDSTYGVSFRYPLKSTMLTAEKAERLPMNFAEPGGVTVTSLELPGSAASSLFHVSVKKGLTQEQCGKFALADPVQGSDAPIQNDDELGPTKVSVRGTEFVKAETVSDELDARYYHHFEPGQGNDGKADAAPGTCYEFALGVLDNPENTKPVDELAMFEKLERIFHTVTIKQPETPAAVTASAPSATMSASNPQ
jgi:hypothetical protein